MNNASLFIFIVNTLSFELLVLPIYFINLMGSNCIIYVKGYCVIFLIVLGSTFFTYINEPTGYKGFILPLVTTYVFIFTNNGATVNKTNIISSNINRFSIYVQARLSFKILSSPYFFLLFSIFYKNTIFYKIMQYMQSKLLKKNYLYSICKG